MRVELEVSEDISVNDNIFTTINDELITGEEGYLDIEDTSDEYNYDCVKFKVKSSTVIAGV